MESAFFRENRITNIGKSWSNKYYAKISGQNQFEKVNFEKIFTKTFQPFIETFLKEIMTVRRKINRSLTS